MPSVKAETEVSYPLEYVYELAEGVDSLPQILPKLVKSSKIVRKEGTADIAKLELNLTPTQKSLVQKMAGGDPSNITTRVTRQKNKCINIERIDGPFKSFTIRLTFNNAAAGKTRLCADIAFDAGGWGVANKALVALFNAHAGDFLSDANSGIAKAIADGHLKLPPPRAGCQG